ncbi:endonuclease I [bacterium]|jgi:hypothetical protein|nr:endonuclease I [bacterium]|tara:strand:+ start:240 stop:692 length:453 start_codon:yes stop_codon:yes gene_type:complete
MNYARFSHARKYGYRSGLEKKLADELKALKVKFSYESLKIEWEDLAYRTYTPDFILDNGIIIESKGMFTAADRRKHLAIQRQHPKLDIRFIFENSRRKLRKGAKSTYAEWCIKYNFRYGTRVVPEEWLKEKGKNKHSKFISFTGTKRRIA